MNKKLEWIIIIFMLVILAGLSACSQKTFFANKPKPHQTNEEYQAEITKEMEQMDSVDARTGDSISNLQGVANALVCVFAPDECQAKKDLAQTENEK